MYFYQGHFLFLLCAYIYISNDNHGDDVIVTSMCRSWYENEIEYDRRLTKDTMSSIDEDNSSNTHLIASLTCWDCTTNIGQ